jgi:hypothetical protein
MEDYRTAFSKIVPSFAARISACFAYMEASVDESGNY